ncbi:MAG: recombinase family protein, partial [Candidatus Cloacimonetes bacterium]|nr:recombinase family protein [Candidatus Cloacimonadota bacterium]
MDEDVAPHIKRLFQMKLESYSNQEMIDYLKDHDIKTTKGSDITNATQLRCILTNEKYIGQLTYGKTYIKKINNDKVTMINKGEKPKYIIRNHHEAIIDHD